LITGAPSDDADHYLLWQASGVKLFHHVKLRPKSSAVRIRIRLRRFLFMKWLELEGAHAMVAGPTEAPPLENPPISSSQTEK
jgi:hypothetical protein